MGDRMKLGPVFALSTLLLALAAQPAWSEAKSGPRIELIGGSDALSGRFEDTAYSKGGMVYGANLGYDRALSSVLAVGFDGELGGAGTRSTVTGTTAPSTIKFKTGRELYLGARVSVHGPRASVYIKAGIANLTRNEQVDGEDFIAGYNAVRAGLGGTFMLTSSIYGLAEYRYTKYKRTLSRDQILTGIGFRF